MGVGQSRRRFWFRHRPSHVILSVILLLYVLFFLVFAVLPSRPLTLLECPKAHILFYQLPLVMEISALFLLALVLLLLLIPAPFIYLGLR